MPSATDSDDRKLGSGCSEGAHLEIFSPRIDLKWLGLWL